MTPRWLSAKVAAWGLVRVLLDLGAAGVARLIMRRLPR
jgi:hypothetical protein